MRNNLEMFISGQVAINLSSSKDAIALYHKMIGLGFSSIKDIDLEEIAETATNGFVAEYIPGEGFIFDYLSNINTLTIDMYTSDIQVISINELFETNIKVAV